MHAKSSFNSIKTFFITRNIRFFREKILVKNRIVANWCWGLLNGLNLEGRSEILIQLTINLSHFSEVSSSWPLEINENSILDQGGFFLKGTLGSFCRNHHLPKSYRLSLRSDTSNWAKIYRLKDPEKFSNFRISWYSLEYFAKNTSRHVPGGVQVKLTWWEFLIFLWCN